MSELNFELLEKNIRLLLEKKRISQQQLAEIAGMTQANVSKSLNPNEKKRFTLDQVYRIAQHFGISIDSLVGNTPTASSTSDIQEAFLFIVKFLCAGNLRTEEMTITEMVYEPHYDQVGYGECTPYDKENGYLVFFFPDYRRFSDYKLSEQEEVDLHMEFCACGNDTKFYQLNKVLKKMIPLIAQYRDGDISEEAFQMIVDGYLKQLMGE